MVEYRGEITLQHITAQEFNVSGVDNALLSEEILVSQQRLSYNPVLPLYEDTVFSPVPGSEGDKLLNFLRAHFAQYGLQIAEQWSQIHQPLESTGLHHHQNHVNVYGFVYYVRVPENAGVLTFQFENEAQTTIQPVVGLMYMFPSWVKHKVSKNLSGQTRISVAGNLVRATN